MYLVKLPEQPERGVELNEIRRGEWVATLDNGTQVQMEIRGSREGEFHVKIDGVLHKFSLQQGGDGEFAMLANGDAFPFEIVHAADLVMKDGRGKTTIADATEETLTSPITGIIVDVPINVGDRVERGQPVVVVEAMKMENGLGAPIEGVISQVFVQPGDTIFVGDKLVEIQGGSK